MKNYVKPNMEVKKFDVADIIATSIKNSTGEVEYTQAIIDNSKTYNGTVTGNYVEFEW